MEAKQNLENEYRGEILRMLAEIHSIDKLRMIWVILTNMKKD